MFVKIGFMAVGLIALDEVLSDYCRRCKPFRGIFEVLKIVGLCGDFSRKTFEVIEWKL